MMLIPNAWLSQKEIRMISEVDIKDWVEVFPPSEPGKKPESIRSSILNEANGIVNGARANVYGGPEDSFKTIGQLWGVYLNKVINPADVAAMLALMKVARIRQSPNHRDSWVDIAGYAACGAECGLK
jgi:hypothetical protein